jgi:hypothetical protein
VLSAEQQLHHIHPRGSGTSAVGQALIIISTLSLSDWLLLRLLLLHPAGGAFMAGEPLMYQPAYRKWMRQLADQGIKARVFAVGYPLAPENPFPRGVQGVTEAYQWLVKELGSSDSIILGEEQPTVGKGAELS